MPVECIEVRTTTDTKEDAAKIANALVISRLAACVQISSPIVSTYWWKEQVETAEEWICTAKTRKDLYDAVEKAIRAVHSYDEPEIIAIDIVNGSESYLDWIKEETTTK